MIQILDEDHSAYHIAIMENGKTDLNKSLNTELLQRGLASTRRDLHSDYKHWMDFESEAKDGQLRIWEHGGGIDDDEQDF